jgi:O-antigen/teichoic acid export membrane protein
MVVLLKFNLSALFVVTIDLLLAIGVFLFSSVYTFAVLHEIPKLSYFDKGQLVEILSFGAAILLQAFVNQINNNVDTMILGVYIEEKYIITMYSSALTIYAIYNSLISVITRYFVPQATKLMTQNASGKELTDFVIKPGRFQAVIAVACICGFALFGRNFIAVWIGERYMDAYSVILMLMIPVTIPLVENAVISILDAAMKRMYRSMVLVVMAVLNVIVSIWLVKRIGFWGAAAGTALSLLVGHGLLMNVYYARTFQIEVVRMFREIFRGILPAGIVSGLLCVPLVLFVPDTLPLLVVKCGCFAAVYGVLLYRFGLNSDEKRLVHTTAKKFIGK